MDQIKAEMLSMREDLAKWVTTNPRLARQLVDDYDALRVRVARNDVNEFIEYVMLDERPGKGPKHVTQAPIHYEFQRLVDQHRRLLLWGHVESGKSSQIAVGRTLFELGHDQELRIAVISSSLRSQSMKITTTLANYIRKSGRLRKVFPGLRPSAPWTNTAFKVERNSISRDPTVQSTSAATSSLIGSRIDIMIIDDLLTHDNTRTQEQRDAVFEWVGSSVVLGRLTDEARVWFLGNAFHPDDTMHRLARNDAVWHFARFPVLDAFGESNWPERWPLSRIEARRKELSPDEFARQMLCIARDDSAGKFKREWIHACMDRGLGKKLATQLYGLPPGYGVFTGVDLGVRKKAGSDPTVLYTIVVHPNGDRELVGLESGRWAGREIVERIIDVAHRYGSVVYVENNGGQQYIVDFAKEMSSIDVRALFTGKNKVHPEYGIEGLATEISNRKWIIPSQPGHRSHPEVMAWADELVYYDPSAHAGDRLMASWIAMQGARQWERRPRMRTGTINLHTR